MSVIQLDNIKNPKHQAVIRQISDIFDNSRGNIREDVAFTKFDHEKHTILFNTKSPDLDGTFLIPYDNDKVLFAPATIKIGVSDQTEFNSSVNLIFNKNNGKSRVWEVTSNNKQIQLMIQMQDKTPIAGFSIMFADSVRTKYKIDEMVLANENGEVISQVAGGMESSWDSNNHQFFQFTNVVPDVLKIKMLIGVVGNVFEWKINNISFYSNMNLESLKNLNSLGIINWSLAPNALLMKDLKQEDMELLKGPSDNNNNNNDKLVSLEQIKPISDYRDKFGSTLPFEPDYSKEHFDSLTQSQINNMTNTKVHSVTESPTKGEKIYTFETDSITRKFELKFQPIDQQSKYSDEPVLSLDKLVEQGYMKKGGFKNYMLTFYIRLDDIVFTDQNLIWKYGGWLSEPNLPDHSKFTDVFIPLGKQAPIVYSEYKYGQLNPIAKMPDWNVEQDNIPSGKWIGLQFIRQVDDENNECVVSIGINRDPINEKGDLQGQFEPFLEYTDSFTDTHIANIWGGMLERIEVTGARYVNITGISLYEIK